MQKLTYQEDLNIVELGEFFFVNGYNRLLSSSNSSLQSLLFWQRSGQLHAIFQSTLNCASATLFSQAILTRNKLAAFLTNIYFNRHLSYNFSTISTSKETHSFSNLCLAPSVTSFDHKVHLTAVPSFIRSAGNWFSLLNTSSLISWYEVLVEYNNFLIKTKIILRNILSKVSLRKGTIRESIEMTPNSRVF